MTELGRLVLPEEEQGSNGVEKDSPSGGGREDDLTLQRNEEEASAGVRERDAGAMNVRKSVRTEREEVQVPKRREEVGVERVPMNEEAPEAKIMPEDEEEIVVRVYEEEVVVTKRVVLKEEIRIRKKVVEEEEVVDVDLRKEEVEIDDQTERPTKRAEPSGRHVS